MKILTPRNTENSEGDISSFFFFFEETRGKKKKKNQHCRYLKVCAWMGGVGSRMNDHMQ